MNNNWYDLHKEAQLYEDVDEDEFEDYDDFKANQYFAIGQNEDTIANSFCWVYRNGKLEVKKGGTHAQNFGRDATDHWRGWYDPMQGLCSVVIPLFAKKKKSLYQEMISEEIGEWDVPDQLKRVLKERFGLFKILVFSG